MKIVLRILMVIVGLALIPITAVATAAIKQKFEDGPNRVFSGGPLLAGELHQGAEPDWSFVNETPTIEMELVAEETSRRIWIASADDRLFVWSGYMDTTVGRIWKQWPVQAEEDGRAVLRIEGTRYERQLQRITDDPQLDQIATVISAKYPTSLAPDTVRSGNVWLFEAAPRN